MTVNKRVYKRDGRRWARFIATVQTKQGRRSRSFTLERDAKTWERTQSALIEQSNIIGGRTPRLTQHLDQWLARGSTRGRKPWTPATRYDYESAVTAHLKPKLGHIRLEDLTVDDVERMLETIPGNRAVNVRTALSSALTMAVRQRLVPYNVAKSVHIRPIARRSGGGLSQEEAKRFLKAAQGSRLYPLFVVTTALALRQSEVVGLRWEDVDLDNQTLQIAQRTYRRGGEYHTGKPKSLSSQRVVHFPAEISDVLRGQRRLVLLLRVSTRDWVEQDLVYPNRTGGPLYGPYVTRRMQKYLADAGIEKRRFHDLRHTGASILHALGVDMKTVQAVLGHADYRLTADTYTHVEDGVMKDAASKMGGFLRG